MKMVTVPMKVPAKAGAKAAAPKAPTKAAPKKAAANRTEFDVRITSTGVVRTIGVVDNLSTKILMLSHKRHGSSKQVITPIPMDDVIFIRGKFLKGEKIEVIYMDDRATCLQLRHAELDGFDEETGMQKGISQEGHPFMVKPGHLRAVTTTDVAAPSIEIGKKF